MASLVRLLILGVCNLLVLGVSVAAGWRLEGRLGGSVALPCDRRPLRHPIEELLVYWQRLNDTSTITVASLEWGTENPDHQHQEYKGRASFRGAGARDGDFTLRLTGLRLQDSGGYQCVVIWNPSDFLPPKTSNITLQVTAEFSTPVIESAMSGELHYAQELTLTCRAHGGVRPARVRWVNSDDGTPMDQSRIQTTEQPHGDLIHLTSTMTINATASINISCVVLTASGNLSSSPYSVVVAVSGGTKSSSQQHGASSALQVSLPVVFIILVVGILAVALLVKGRIGSLSGCPRKSLYQPGEPEISTSSV